MFTEDRNNQVKQGGARCAGRRRYSSIWAKLGQFQNAYKPLADKWAVYENSVDSPRRLEGWP